MHARQFCSPVTAEPISQLGRDISQMVDPSCMFQFRLMQDTRDPNSKNGVHLNNFPSRITIRYTIRGRIHMSRVHLQKLKPSRQETYDGHASSGTAGTPSDCSPHDGHASSGTAGTPPRQHTTGLEQRHRRPRRRNSGATATASKCTMKSRFCDDAVFLHCKLVGLVRAR